jgi:hypothetical protein
MLTVRHVVGRRTGRDVGGRGDGIGGGRKKRRRADGRDAAVVVGYGCREQARGARHVRCRRCYEPLARPGHAARGVPGTYTPPVGPLPVHPNAATARTPGTATAPREPASPALDASQLTEMSAPLPTSPEESTTAPTASPAADESTPLAGMTPTLAETDVPVAAGANGPGPATGSLADLRPVLFGGADTAATPVDAYGESADDKERLQREEREHILAGEV